MAPLKSFSKMLFDQGTILKFQMYYPPERNRALRLRTLSILAVVALLSFTPACFALADSTTDNGATTIPALGRVSSYTLKNGLQVLVIPSDSADLVTVDAWVKAGTRRETPSNNGVAHFLEHLLFRGTTTRKPGDIDAAIEDLGGNLNAETSYDWAHFYVTVASSDADPALGILSDALMNSTLRDEDIQAERPVILNEMARTQASPDSRMTQWVNQLSYTVHPYGRPLLGTPASVSAMTRDTVVAFYNTFYAPNNITLVLSGNITPDQGRAMAEKYLGAWASKPVPADNVTQEPPQPQYRVKTLVGSGTSAYLMFGFHAPAVSDERDAYTMDVLLTILGQGGNNRLDTVLRRQMKIVTSVSANYLTQKDPGMLTILTESDPSQLRAVHDAVLAQIESLCTLPVSNGELNAAKHTLLANYLFDAQTTAGRANAMGFYNSIDTYKYDVDYISNFEAVTPLEVQHVAEKYLNPRAYTLVVCAPRINPEISSRLSRAKDTLHLAESEDK